METESWANLVLRLDQGLYNGKRNFRIVFLIFEKKILNMNIGAKLAGAAGAAAPIVFLVS